MMIQTITKWLMTIFSILTAFGVFMHDGHLDKAAMTSFGTSIDAAQIGKSGHTHADYNGVHYLLTHSFAYKSPSAPPKSRSDRKRRLTLPPEFGRHAFDDILMPVLA